MQSTTGFGIGENRGTGESLNISPVIPARLNSKWDLITLPSLSATYLPGPNGQFGLADLQVSFFLTPHEEAGWIWGAGPILQFPIATSQDFGTGRWSAGPTAALVYSKGPWFNGILVYELMSIAGTRDRGSINQLFLEPDVSYNFESGWFIQCEPSITYDWTTSGASAWTVPMGADIGKAFTAGSQSLSLQVGAYGLLNGPDSAPQWILRASVTFLFPGVTNK
jgi:hypothetical protein